MLHVHTHTHTYIHIHTVVFREEVRGDFDNTARIVHPSLAIHSDLDMSQHGQFGDNSNLPQGLPQYISDTSEMVVDFDVGTTWLKTTVILQWFVKTPNYVITQTSCESALLQTQGSQKTLLWGITDQGQVIHPSRSLALQVMEQRHIVSHFHHIPNEIHLLSLHL